MKRFFVLLIAAALVLPVMGLAETPKIMQLEPGIYKIGTDVPEGVFEFTFNQSDFMIGITCGQTLNTEKDDLEYGGERYFNISMMLNWKENPKLKLFLFPGDYLVIKYSGCTLAEVPTE